MPLDPTIVNMIANPAKMPDPMVQYNNALAVAQGKMGLDKIRREQEQQNALNAAFSAPGALNPDGTINQPVVMNALARAGVGSAIPGQLKANFEIAKLGEETNKVKAETVLTGEKTKTEGFEQRNKQATTDKTKIEAFDKAMTNYQRELAGISHDPAVGIEQLVQWKMRQFADPIVGPMLRERGETPESAIAELKASLKSMPYADFLKFAQLGAEKASEQKYETVNTQDRMVTKAMPAHSLGAPTVTNISTEQVGKDPNAAARAPKVSVAVPVSVINQKGDSAYTETWNKGLAEDDLGLKRAAESAPDLIRRADRVGIVLKGGKVITGAFAGPRLAGEKIAGLFGGGDKEAIANTETLGSDLAKMTLDHIKSSGLGGGNGFTDKDREFLERAVAGQIAWDNASLQRMAQLARQQGEQTIKRWNSRTPEVTSTGIQGSVYPKTRPSVPPAPVQGTSGRPVPPAVIQRFLENKNNPAHIAEIDRKYGPGTAKRILGGK